MVVAAAAPVEVRIFPANDDAFAAFVGAVRAASGDDPDRLQAALRTRYPAAIVRPRTKLASPEGAPPLWYVFRYGSVVPPADRWWEHPGHARAVLDSNRTFLEATDSLARIVEVPLEQLIGAPVEAFSNPEDPSIREDIAAIWQRFLEEAELHATLRFNRLDGSARELEIHLLRDEAGPGRHVAIARESVAGPPRQLIA